MKLKTHLLKISKVMTCFICFIALSWSSVLLAEVKVSVASKKIGLQDQLVASVSFDQPNGQPIFKSDGFVNLGVKSSSTSISIVNGKHSRKTTQTFILKPQKKGAIRFWVEVGQEKSETIEIEVVEGSLRKATNPNQPPTRRGLPPGFRQQMIDPFAAFRQGRGAAPVSADAIIIENQLSKRKIYINEVAVMDTVIFIDRSQANVSDLVEIEKNFSHSGLNMIRVKNLKPTGKVVKRNGKNYDTQVIMRHLIYPIHQGKLEISDGIFNVKRQVSLFNRGQTIRVSVKTVTINAKNYPYSKDFNNQFGDFKLEAKLSTNQIRINEPITLKLTISGEGNFKSLNSPLNANLSDILSSQVKIKQGTIQDNYEVGNRMMKGKKIYEYYIIPEEVGNIRLDEITFTSYSPKQKKLVTKKQKLPNLLVKKSLDPILIKNINQNPEELSMLGEIRYIDTEVSKIFSITQTAFFYHGLGVMVLLVFFLPYRIFNFNKSNDKTKKNFIRQVNLIKTKIPRLEKGMKGDAELASDFSKLLLDYIPIVIGDEWADGSDFASLTQREKIILLNKKIKKNPKLGNKSLELVREKIHLYDSVAYSKRENDIEWNQEADELIEIINDNDEVVTS